MEDDGGNEGDKPPEEEGKQLEIEDLIARMTLQSLIEFTKPNTMKLVGYIGEQEVLVLVDLGATSNFISTPVARRLNLEVSPCKSFGVTLGTGLEVFGDGICRDVVLTLQDITISNRFFALKLGSVDVIFGVQWLIKLGTVTIN